MSAKRPFLAPPRDLNSLECLDFHEWKAQQASYKSDKRHGGLTYDSSSEDLPDHPWYALDVEKLRDNIERMCDDLGQPLSIHNALDPEMSDLPRALNRAKQLPRPRKMSIAVVGDQGVGKSSTINALLNRHLVDASASSSACTAFATIIEHKPGTSDDTDESDLKVTFYTIDEIRDFIEEHIRRYADVYAPHDFTNYDAQSEVLSDEDASESEMSEVEVAPVYLPKRKIPKAMKLGADTAEQFFRLIFGVDDDQRNGSELDEWLSRPGLEDGHFLLHCTGLAEDHLAQLHAKALNTAEFTNVKDANIPKIRDKATKMWPLVKAVTISTGSVLLRNGIRFMDLPGSLLSACSYYLHLC